MSLTLRDVEYASLRRGRWQRPKTGVFMVTKRYTQSPDKLLQSVIEGLERGTRAGVREAQLSLLSQGPLMCSEALLRELNQSNDDELALLGGELLAFLRTLVGRDGALATITVYSSITFTAALHPGKRSAACFA